MKKKETKGQIELSFGMIFSIILIIIFLGFAFYAIKAFLGFQNNAKAGRFFDQVQSDTDRVWQSAQSSEQQDYVVPSYADLVCLIDFSSGAKGQKSGIYSELKKTRSGSENVVFYPVKFTGFESKELKHLDISKITENENPFCLNASNGKVSLTLKKDFGEALVTIERAG
jgi:hypothetical protein